MTQVFIFHIDLFLKYAMVRIDHQYRLNRETVILDPILRFYRHCFFFKLDISTAKYQKDFLIFYVSCYY